MAYILQALILIFVASAMSGSHGDSGEKPRGGPSRRGRRRQTSFFASAPVTSNPEPDVIQLGGQNHRGSLMRVGGRASTTLLTRESLRAERVSAMDRQRFSAETVQRHQQRLQAAKDIKNAKRRATREARRCELSTHTIKSTVSMSSITI